MQKAPLFARDNPRASESDITRMTGGSRTEGTPYHRHIHHTVEGDHRQEGLHSGRENTSRITVAMRPMKMMTPRACRPWSTAQRPTLPTSRSSVGGMKARR